MTDIELVAFGDSVVWGQGLAHSDKFATVAADWFEAGSMAGAPDSDALPVDRIQARSGAVIGDGDWENDGLTPLPGSLSRVARHEVPNSAPTIIEQVDAYPETAYPGESVSLPDPDDVDVVIVDGGINDTGAASALDPSTPRSDLDRDTERHNYQYMLMLLERTRATFPTATIVVTGYFPVFSGDSDLSEAVSKIQASSASDTDSEDILVGVAGGIFAVADFFSNLGEDIVGNALHFHRRQLHQLRRAVSEFGVAPANGSGGVVFAHPGYGPENALFAGNSWLFEPQEDGDLDVARERRAACVDLDAGYKCELANVAHPDVDGARSYAESVVTAHDRYHDPAVRETLADLENDPQPTFRQACDRYGLDPGSGLRACLSHRVVDCLEVTVETADVTLQMVDPDDIENLPLAVYAVAKAIHARIDQFRQLFVPGTGSRIALELETSGDPIQVPLDHPVLVDFEPGSREVYVVDPHLDPPHRTLELGEIEGVALVKDQLFGELSDLAMDVIESLPLPSGYVEQAVRELVYTDWEPEHFALSVNGVPVHEESMTVVLSGDDRWEASYPR